MENSQGNEPVIVAEGKTPQALESVVPTEAAPIAQATPLSPATPFYKNKQLIVAFIVAILILGGAGYFAYIQYYKDGGVVATVNGTKIYKKEFEESIMIIEQAALAQQVNVTDEVAREEIKKQALDVLVNNALIISGAKKAGFVASDEDVQEKYEELVTSVGSAEELQKRMKDVGLTEEKLRGNIVERILADQYIESETPIKEITVTDEEIQAFLSALNVEESKLPPMEEFRPQLEAEIKNQKQQKIVSELIQKLRSEATIKTNI